MSPNFLLGPIASTKLHAPFLKERRTRGPVWGSVQEIRGVCVGVAGTLHGLNKMGRSPFQCFLLRAKKPRPRRNLTERATDAKPTCPGMPWRDQRFRGPLLENAKYCTQTTLSSRPERSAVERSAVFFYFSRF